MKIKVLQEILTWFVRPTLYTPAIAVSQNFASNFITSENLRKKIA